MRLQRGFTLLELMVAMSIFAMLAVAGWQVFDSVNRARERAQYHADNLAVLQYAYLQLQQDMGQIVAYQAPDAQNASNNTINNSGNNSGNNSSNNSSNNTNNNNASSNQSAAIAAKPLMTLDGEHVSFVRFADPDPRYQSSISVQRVEYIFADQRLIRRQYTSIQGGRDGVSLDSVLLDGVTVGRWQAYLPEISSEFPSIDSGNNNFSIALGQIANDKPETILLPKGIALNFTYQDMPITWRWALAPQSLP
ncbi:general secretion pathway protein J [Psychrobacter sp. PL15]|uniref:type II secretion system protein GspJ n=1 Tax=Psychrobacter sp. PL15 TaxID=3071719 RepID=UPI002E07C707|nr:general secretion pathway protein J [Psychrobacter sp. PL15]